MNSSLWPKGLAVLLALSATILHAQQLPLGQIAQTHPASQTIESLMTKAAAVDSFRGTGLSKADYLTLIAGNVDFFKQHQNAAGAIIDPYDHNERQYSTPAFALDAALLVRDAKRDDLLDPAIRAMTFATAALANHTTADGHADFYIPLLIHARRILHDRVPREILDAWDRQLRGLVPQTAYRDVVGRNNWNLVNVCGECLRRKDGLVPEDQLGLQQAYLDQSLTSQLTHFTSWGMFQDPNVPLAYDAFPRLWLEDMMFDSAYAGKNVDALRQKLSLGGLSTLLLFSPSGEWISGGRSANHQWNEAQVAVIAEINAVKWKSAGQESMAGAFKRMAHLALTSIRRWQRPSGELWVVKNFADPANRHGYEAYSYHSQYNLLTMAMLVIAYELADESIAEHPVPSEYGDYVLDLRDPFHKVVAAAGGTYIVIDTNADPHYNATGLQRIQRRGVDLSPLSDSASADRAYGPDNTPKAAIAPGIQWKNGADGAWLGLVDGVKSCDLTDIATPAGQAQFNLRFAGANGEVEEHWIISDQGVECSAHLTGDAPPASTRFVFPAMVSDGAKGTTIAIDSGVMTIIRPGGKLRMEILEPAAATFGLEGPRIATHNGFVRAASADLSGARQVRWRARLEN